MKPLKRAQQHNTEINKDMYGVFELKRMLNEHEIFFFDENHEVSYDTKFCEGKDLRIFLDEMKEIKVIMNEYGHYTNVAINQEDTKYYICL